METNPTPATPAIPREGPRYDVRTSVFNANGGERWWAHVTPHSAWSDAPTPDDLRRCVTGVGGSIDEAVRAALGKALRNAITR